MIKFLKWVIFLGAMQTTAYGQVLVNAGFESVSSYSTYSAPGSFPGWTLTTGSAGLPLSSLGSPQAGTQVLVPAFTASPGTSTLTQSISGFSIGTTYQLSFYTSAYSSTSYFGTSNGLVSLGTGSTSFSYVIPAENRLFGSVASPWVQRSFLYTATGSTAVLTLSVTHSSNDPYIGFDSFSLAAVPEPSAHALLGLGITGLVMLHGFRLKRRRSEA